MMCPLCSDLLEKFAKLRRQLRYLILTPSDDKKPVDLQNIWDLFSTLDLEGNAEESRCIPTPNPSSLYTVSHYTNYVERKLRRKRKSKNYWFH